jgi:hypothetical protein
MSVDNSSLRIVLPDEGGNGESGLNQSLEIGYQSETVNRGIPAWHAGLRKAAAVALFTAPLGAASFAGLPAAGGADLSHSTSHYAASTEAYSPRATRRARLAKLKAKRFSDVGREARIERALQALTTMPDTIQLGTEDAQWIAEDPDLEDL